MVVPFRGAAEDLHELRSRLTLLERRRGDSLTVVDNTPGRAAPGAAPGDPVQVLHVADIAAPGFARNRGAARGRAEWLVFFDADVEPSPDLLDRYFEPAPQQRTGLIAGGVTDEAVAPGGPAVARYAHIRRFMSQADTLRLGDWGYPKTANAACRRTAFEAVDGFRDEIRAGEDADLTFRLRAAGWAVERREDACVVHRSRQTVAAFVSQKLCHGSGAAWLDREYPGAFPARRLPGLVWWGARHAAGGLWSAARSRSRDDVLWALLDPVELIAHEVGRSLPNERPLSVRRVLRHFFAPARAAGGRAHP